MQQAARAEANPALEHAAGRARHLGLPLAVVFCLVDDYPDASARHYRFLLEGLAGTMRTIRRRGIATTVRAGPPGEVVAALARPAALLVTDRAYLPVPLGWRDDVMGATTVAVDEVEAGVVVPIDLVSDRVEVAARTIRSRIMDHLDRFAVETDPTPVAAAAGPLDLPDAGAPVDPDRPGDVVRRLGVPGAPGPVPGWRGGAEVARSLLDRFTAEVLPSYADARERYDRPVSSSLLSPYLHFGQISPVEVLRRARAAGAPAEHVAAFVDELVVQRELSVNLVARDAAFDTFAGLPDWARRTLADHADDEREAVYTAGELEAGRTHDEVWNAVMADMRERGFVHNQLRMYWGKQILRWTERPEEAFRVALDLNNRYFLDGRDPNSYANVAWCFGRHDRPFQDRPVIGTIRPFTRAALRRKGDLDGWLAARTGADADGQTRLFT